MYRSIQLEESWLKETSSLKLPIHTVFISQSSFSRVFIDVIDAFNDNLKSINFPSDAANLVKIKADFYKFTNFPNGVGAVDGTQIAILGMSSDDEHVFISRKGFHAINMQGIVTADLKQFIFITFTKQLLKHFFSGDNESNRGPNTKTTSRY